MARDLEREMIEREATRVCDELTEWLTEQLEAAGIPNADSVYVSYDMSPLLAVDDGT